MRLTSLLAILCVAVCATAFADLYNNGPTNGTVNAWNLYPYVVSDSFQVSANATMTSFTFAEWVPAGSTPLTVDWAIGTSPYGRDLGLGHAAPIYASLLCSSGQPFNGGTCGGDYDYDIYNSTVTIPSAHLFAGQTYWLTLRNSTDNFGDVDGWDINSGPSQAYHSLLGAVPSESFTINGTAATTPEPGSIVLLGTGILGLAGILRRRLR